jgi:hypothetical protein
VGWLTFTVGVITGASGTVAPVLVAWRQRVIQIRDRTADHEEVRVRELERQEREAKIRRREQWQPEYDAIRKHLDCGETLAYDVLLRGPFTKAEFDALDAVTLRMNSEILANRDVVRLCEPLLELARLFDALVENAVLEEASLRRAVLQDRAARDLVDLIKNSRRILRTEWGD